jgi:uncharacterized protein (TIGR02599 family)
MTPALRRVRAVVTAFTLLEMLVSLSVLGLLIALFAGLIQHTNTIWTRTTGKVEQFRSARDGFETMTTRFAQATLNVHWDYDNQTSPTKYERNSDLRFISGPVDELLGTAPAGRQWLTGAAFFQAPFGETLDPTPRGFESLLCTWGYFLEYGDDLQNRPDFVTTTIQPPRYRYRLMELRQAAEQNTIFNFTSGFDGSGMAQSRSYRGRQWFRDAVNATNPPVHALAENVIALIITPRLSQADEAKVAQSSAGPDFSPLAPNYLYDTAPAALGTTDSRYQDGRLNPTNQLPPLLQVTMVTIDEASALRMDLRADTTDPFGVAGGFRKTADFSRDLLQTGDPESLENRLIARSLHYRIFTTNVQIRGAKWSRVQTN